MLFGRIIFLLVLTIVAAVAGINVATAQERTVIEFYSETPAVSDLIVEVEPHMTGRVKPGKDGWRIPPGQLVRIEIKYPPPDMIISEVRLGFSWNGGVISSVFQGFALRKDRFLVFEELLSRNENQKRIYPDLYARGYEFRIQAKFHQRAPETFLLLQSLIIYWEPNKKDGEKRTQDNEP